MIRSMKAVIGSERRASSWTCSRRGPHDFAHVEQGLPGGRDVGAVTRRELLDPVAQLAPPAPRPWRSPPRSRAGSRAARPPSPCRCTCCSALAAIFDHGGARSRRCWPRAPRSSREKSLALLPIWLASPTTDTTTPRRRPAHVVHRPRQTLDLGRHAAAELDRPEVAGAEPLRRTDELGQRTVHRCARSRSRCSDADAEATRRTAPRARLATLVRLPPEVAGAGDRARLVCASTERAHVAEQRVGRRPGPVRLPARVVSSGRDR